MSGFLFLSMDMPIEKLPIKMPRINIITQMLVFFMFAIALNLFHLTALFIAAGVLIAILTQIKNHQFYRLVKRLKWFYIVMLIIYALNTPGEHLAGWPFSVSPTYEGFSEGVMQLLRITIMLATVSLILSTNTRQQLISGFYFLLSPLKCFGLDAERFSARLWLTLHYVELQQDTPQKMKSFKQFTESLSSIFGETDYENITINFERPVFSGLDIVLIFLTLVLFLLTLFKVVI